MDSGPYRPGHSIIEINFAIDELISSERMSSLPHQRGHRHEGSL